MTLMSTRSRWQKLAGLDGLVSEESGRALAVLASRVPANQAVVNIGVFKGKSLCYLAEGARLGNGSKVYGCDPWNLPGNPDGRHHYHSAQDDCYRQLEECGFGDGGSVTTLKTGMRGFLICHAMRWLCSMTSVLGATRE